VCILPHFRRCVFLLLIIKYFLRHCVRCNRWRGSGATGWRGSGGVVALGCWLWWVAVEMVSWWWGGGIASWLRFQFSSCSRTCPIFFNSCLWLGYMSYNISCAMSYYGVLCDTIGLIVRSIYCILGGVLVVGWVVI
jgi:hypothetical protein